MITDLLTRRIYFNRYHSDKHFPEFYLQDGGKKTTGIDMEQNDVTVTLCILGSCRRGGGRASPRCVDVME